MIVNNHTEIHIYATRIYTGWGESCIGFALLVPQFPPTLMLMCVHIENVFIDNGMSNL